MKIKKLKPSEIFAAAQKVFKRYAWVQNVYEDGNFGDVRPAYCLIGACNKVKNLPSIDSSALHAVNKDITPFLVRAIKNKFGVKVTEPEAFNDAETTKRKDVLAVLKEAEALAKAKGK